LKKRSLSKGKREEEVEGKESESNSNPTRGKREGGEKESEEAPRGETKSKVESE